MPEHEQPGRGLEPGAEQTARREQTGKREAVRDGQRGGEQVAAGQHGQARRAQETELTEQQDSRDQVEDDERRPVDRNEGLDPWKRLLGERHQGEKEHDRAEHDDEREPPLAWSGGHRRQECLALFCWVADHMPSSTISRRKLREL